MKRIPLAVLACAIVAMAQSQAATAGDKSDDRSGFIRGTGRIDPHARYENDIAYEFGTVTRRGTKTIPYVERCYWTARPGFFILPTDIKQVCTRYTLENTE